MLARNKRALPPNVHMVKSRGREYFYFQMGRGTDHEGPRLKLTDPWSQTELALAWAMSEKNRFDLALARACIAAKTRAFENKLPFSIDAQFIHDLATRQSRRCAVSGIAFESEGYGDCRAKPFSPSIDRIDPSHGYTKDNVRLVCLIANYAMSEWGVAVLEKLALAVAERIEAKTVKHSVNLQLSPLKSLEKRGIE